MADVCAGASRGCLDSAIHAAEPLPGPKSQRSPLVYPGTLAGAEALGHTIRTDRHCEGAAGRPQSGAWGMDCLRGRGAIQFELVVASRVARLRLAGQDDRENCYGGPEGGPSLRAAAAAGNKARVSVERVAGGYSDQLRVLHA